MKRNIHFSEKVDPAKVVMYEFHLLLLWYRKECDSNA